ncbi:archaetidylserine decarboxylase [Candidatus Purcelliella pentastirinorum]|uniref:archaetidylserine decarboxylase n=1 Tax=Candidatus Purcelliella pentastirinorum TaxID=472834 RepID=UPI002367C51F|nr:archaetidylserine decarboxylase [Candidatus Purcelliella pentastirinorum]WDI78786.1 archaetidylserine decarboxylase [Candidatus Purcelliella pentastirinorum]WDR79919.1 archaetidylserine decarboxylase [Candidatus Purcelliella pentastirinorum]
MFFYIKYFLNIFFSIRCFTKFAGWLSNKKLGIFTSIFIKIFIWFYKINILEFEIQNISHYNTFNDFFTRKLLRKFRPIDFNINSLIFPADGIISQFGIIKNDSLIQAKRFYFSLTSLLADNIIMANKFINGSFLTIYLPPYTCHRIYMPCDGLLREVVYIPGKLYSVSFFSMRSLPNLFIKNERMIFYFDTKFGLLAQVLIGASLVGSIETIWSKIINFNKKDGVVKRWINNSLDINTRFYLLKGEEVGYFRLGSTIINLFPFKKIEVEKNIFVNKNVNFGSVMGKGNIINNNILNDCLK